MGDSHADGRAKAAAIVLQQWRELAASARKAGMIELAEKAEEQVRIREHGAAKGST